MTTTIRLWTQAGKPYNVSVDVYYEDVRTMGETLPHLTVTGARFSVDVVAFDDLAKMVAALTPSITTVELRSALQAGCTSLGQVLR